VTRKWKIGLGVFAALLVIGAVEDATKKKPEPSPTAASTAVHSTAPAPSTVGATSASPTAVSTSASKPPAAASQPASAPSAPAKSSGGCALQTKRDVLVRTVAPGSQPYAQTLGDVDVANCRSVFELLKATSPTGAGYCTTAAYASDNPGYNADAVPAAPLRKQQLSIGAGCA